MCLCSCVYFRPAIIGKIDISYFVAYCVGGTKSLLNDVSNMYHKMFIHIISAYF